MARWIGATARLAGWFLKFELKTLPNVAEVATVGVTQSEVTEAIGKANHKNGGAVLEMAETEFIVQASGYLKTLNDFRAIPLKLGPGSVTVTLMMSPRFN